MISPLEEHLARSLVRAAGKRARRDNPGDKSAQNLQAAEAIMEAVKAAIAEYDRPVYSGNVVPIRRG